MGLAVSIPFSKLFSGISANTIFKDCAVQFEDRLAHLSANSTSLFGFETRLGMGMNNPDMALCFSKDNFGFLADWCDSLSPNLNSENYWWRVKEIAQGKGNSLQEHLNLVWIEMDRSGLNVNGLLEPGFFLELKKEKIDSQFVSRHVVPVLTGNNNHCSSSMVEFCLSQCPETGRLVHLGYFPERSMEKLRLTISFSHYSDIAPYCSRVFGDELNGRILARIEELSEFSDYGVLHLDIGSNIEKRLGIEMRFRDNEQNPQYQWRWGNLFSRLVDRGLCSSEEAESILGFSGKIRFIDDSTFNPSWYKYFLYYIKGVFDFSGKEHYKAYCAFRRLSPHLDN